MSARLIRMLPSAAPAPATAAPSVDLSELVAEQRKTNELLYQLILEMQKKKKWSFAIAKDQLGRPMQVDANQL